MLKITISLPRTVLVELGHGCRIAIIGGGFTGAAVAHLQAERVRMRARDTRTIRIRGM